MQLPNFIPDDIRSAAQEFPSHMRKRFVEQLLQLENDCEKKGLSKKEIANAVVARARLEIVAHHRIQERAKQMREEDAANRKLALLLTFLVFVVAVCVGVYLSDERRLYQVHEYFAKWYYYLFVQDSKRGTRLFLERDEDFDLYS